VTIRSSSAHRNIERRTTSLFWGEGRTVTVSRHLSVCTGAFNCHLRLNANADPRSENQHALLSSSRCLDSLVRKRNGTPKNSTNQVIIKEDNIKIEEDRKYTGCSQKNHTNLFLSNIYFYNKMKKKTRLTAKLS
jgi:hypothetical protein